MAINLPLTDIATREERTWRANIETPVAGNYAIQVYREIVDKDDEGKVVNVTKKAGVVERAAAAIASESVTLPGWWWHGYRCTDPGCSAAVLRQVGY